MGKPKKYKIKLLSDILDIPEDRFDDFLVQLKLYYEFMLITAGFGKVVEPNMKPSKMLKGSAMTWIDDGKNDEHIILKPSKKTERNI